MLPLKSFLMFVIILSLAPVQAQECADRLGEVAQLLNVKRFPMVWHEVAAVRNPLKVVFAKTHNDEIRVTFTNQADRQLWFSGLGVLCSSNESVMLSLSNITATASAPWLIQALNGKSKSISVEPTEDLSQIQLSVGIFIGNTEPE